MNENDQKLFECNLNDTNLFSCILDEVGEKNLDFKSVPLPILPDRTYINCINASIVNCLKNNKEELDFPQIQLKIIKNENNEWLINQINVVIDKQFDDNLLTQRINQCFKFVKRACSIDDSIDLSIIQLETKEELKYYKLKLNEINKLLQEIKNNKSKREELYSLFKDMASNK
ncbi:MAG: hypothetical protein ACFFC3_13865 [Candidatus Odinarchaeota archaeon]